MIYSFLYVFIASMGAVITEFLDSTIHPLFSLFFACSIAALFFNLINILKLRYMYKKCWEQKWLCLAIMITILVMWTAAVMAPGLIGASLYIFLFFTCLGMLGFFSLCFIDWEKNKIKFYFGFAALLLISFAIWHELKINFSSDIIFGIFLSLVGGVCAFVYFKQSQLILKQAQLSATQILAVRFYLAIIASFFLIPRGTFIIDFTAANLLGIACLALLALIAPLFFQQKALERITAEQNAIIVSLTPAVTACLQKLIFRSVSLTHFFIYGFYTFLVVLSYVVKSRKVLGGVK